MKNQLGIWIDFREAFIIRVTDHDSKVLHLRSEIEDYNLWGGSRSNVPYGPMDKVSETKLLERRKHQEKTFYKRVIASLGPVDAFMIFGPAEAKIGLKNYLEKLPELSSKLMAVETADSMSENQRIATVKSFFKIED